MRRITLVRGVQRVALIGSIVTDKCNPKDIDFLLTVSAEIDMGAAALAGRRLKGSLQGYNSGADVFLCDIHHQYIGRTCSYRECRPRVACEGTDCRPDSRLATDFHLVKLHPDLCKNPPVIVWPIPHIAVPIPDDVAQMLERLTARGKSAPQSEREDFSRDREGPP
ncbi:MAG: hypothetical protein JNJ88_01565 [Planctomycetes bacterium]|nr:hypothetical protein [Planctomycetota bacterium]